MSTFQKANSGSENKRLARRVSDRESFSGLASLNLMKANFISPFFFYDTRCSRPPTPRLVERLPKCQSTVPLLADNHGNGRAAPTLFRFQREGRPVLELRELPRLWVDD